MHIIIKEHDKKQLRLHLPSGLVINRLSAGFLSASLKKKGIDVSGKQMHILLQEIKKYKSAHPEWKLVEVYGQSGEFVEIVP